jgi:hypothetical protein
MPLSAESLAQLMTVPGVAYGLQGRAPTDENIITTLRVDFNKRSRLYDETSFGLSLYAEEEYENRPLTALSQLGQKAATLSVLSLLWRETQDAKYARDSNERRFDDISYRKPPRNRLDDIKTILGAVKEDPVLLHAVLNDDANFGATDSYRLSVLQKLLKDKNAFPDNGPTTRDVFGYLAALKSRPDLLQDALCLPLKMELVRQTEKEGANTFTEAFTGHLISPLERTQLFTGLFDDCPELLARVITRSPSVIEALEKSIADIQDIQKDMQRNSQNTPFIHLRGVTFESSATAYLAMLSKSPPALFAELGKASKEKDHSVFTALERDHPTILEEIKPVLKRGSYRDQAQLLEESVYHAVRGHDMLANSTKSYSDFREAIRNKLQQMHTCLADTPKERDALIAPLAQLILLKYMDDFWKSDAEKLLAVAQAHGVRPPNPRSPEEMFYFTRVLTAQRQLNMKQRIDSTGYHWEQQPTVQSSFKAYDDWESQGKAIIATRHNTHDVKDTLGSFVTYVVLPAIAARMNDEQQNTFKQSGTIVEITKQKAMNVLFGERGAVAALAASKRYHEREHYVIDAVRDWPMAGTWHSLFGKKEIVVDSGLAKGWKIINLTDGLELRDEGKEDAMDHCVPGYVPRCLTGNTHIFSLRDENNNRRSTLQLEVADKNHIPQSYREHPEYIVHIPDSNKVLLREQNNGVRNKRFASGVPEEQAFFWLKSEVESGRLPFDKKRELGRDYKGAKERGLMPQQLCPIIDTIGFMPTKELRQRAFDVFADRHKEVLQLKDGSHFMPESYRGMDVDEFLQQTRLLEPALAYLKINDVVILPNPFPDGGFAGRANIPPPGQRVAPRDHGPAQVG